MIIILLRLTLISLRYFADHQNIYIDHKIDNTTIKEKNEIDISMIYNVLSERKM